MPLVLNSCGSRWPGALSDIKKNFKRQSTANVLPNFRDKALIKSIQKKGSCCPRLLVVKPKSLTAGVYLFPSKLGG